MIQQGIEYNKASFLVSIIGISSMISRILFGYLSDLPTVDTLTVIYISTTMTSVVVFCIPFCSSYITLSVAATLYGLFSCNKTWHFLVFATVTILLNIFIFPIALFVSLSSIVLAEMLGTSQVVKSYGLLCVTYGVSILGTPLAGN